MILAITDAWSAISTHVPREGDDNFVLDVIDQFRDFNPRPPRGGRPSKRHICEKLLEISTHVPREGDDRAKVHTYGLVTISTHVPREGDDWWNFNQV